MADLFARLDRVIIKVAEVAIVAALIIIFALVLLLVVLRYAFGSTIVGGNEFIVVLFIYTTSIGAAVAVSRKEHIAISFLVDRLADGPRRILEILGFALIALINDDLDSPDRSFHPAGPATPARVCAGRRSHRLRARCAELPCTYRSADRRQRESRRSWNGRRMIATISPEGPICSS